MLPLHPAAAVVHVTRGTVTCIWQTPEQRHKEHCEANPSYLASTSS